MKLSIVAPAYNESQNIEEFILRLKTVLVDCEYEIIIIDDGSKDNTAEIAEKNGVRVLKHPYRIGNGAAVKTGLRNAFGDVIILLDADLQHPPEEIPKLLKDIESYDMVVGSRVQYGGTWHRKTANKLFNLLASYVTKSKILDLTSGFRIIRADIAKKFIYLLPNGFSYPTTLTLSLLRSGRSVKFIPVRVEDRKAGGSKINIFKDGIRFVLIIVKIATIYSPFKIFLPVSFFFLFSGLCYYLYTYFAIHRFTNMSLLLLVTAVIIFMLSLIAEQVSQLYLKDTE